MQNKWRMTLVVALSIGCFVSFGFYAERRLHGLWPGAGTEWDGDRQRQFHAGRHFGQRPVYIERRRRGALGRFVHPNESAAGGHATKHYAGGKQFSQHHPDRLGATG